MATHIPKIIHELSGELVEPLEGKKWFVVHTKPRCEKKLVDYANKLGFDYYLPIIKKEKRYQRRKITSFLPMFPGYVFVVLSIQDKDCLTYSGLIVRYLKVTNQKRLLDELGYIYFGKKKDVSMEQAVWLSKGLMVEVCDGPLKGMNGIVESHEKISEVHLQVNILKQAVKVSIDPRHVKVLGEYEVTEEEL